MNRGPTAGPTRRTTGYGGASEHYLSAERRDPVKQHWEEPVNHRVLSRAMGHLSMDPGSRLEVLDIGAGTGDGLALLEAALGPAPAPRVRYIGLDPDPEMIETARTVHAHRDDVLFVQGDVRNGIPPGEFDLYLSAGVPYSHLTEREFTDALTGILERVRTGGHRVAVILDVLGRYSLEWSPNWHRSRWDYNMSFFHGGGLDADMSFHDRRSLTGIVLRAAAAAGVRLAGLELVDRAVAVGRHTTTAAFDPDVPPYRQLVNRLFAGDTEVPLRELELGPISGVAPPEVEQFFTRLTQSWNTRIRNTVALEADHGTTPGSR